MGAHIAMARLMRAPNPTSLRALFVVVISFMTVLPFGSPDPTAADALLNFKASLGNNSQVLYNWGTTLNPCDGNKGNWVGVLCFNGNVRGLQLEGMNLQGRIDMEPLVALPFLKTLSFTNNSFDGPLPELKKLKRLRSVYLSYNHFSGDIPDDAFEDMIFLRKLYLGKNSFTGHIPSSLAELPRLFDLGLEDNKFSGEIPVFKSKIYRLNVANNNLEGEVPESLRGLDPSSFEGNAELCGDPMGRPCSAPPAPAPAPAPPPVPATPAPSPDSPRESTSLGLKIALSIVSIFLGLALIAAIVILLKKRRRKASELDRAELLDDSTKYTTATAGSGDTKSVETNHVHHAPRRTSEHGKLSFVRDDRQKFDLHDLLRASAEVLGSGNFGASYKACILTDAVVVKRYKQMNNVGREEFHEHMRRLGKLTHQNLLPLVAYYYRREEKLLVSDFVENSSLASHLHANHNSNQPGLDWSTRLRIIKGVARGLTYLYKALPSLVVPHGHLKSSNVLLDENMEPLLNDYALLPVINMEQAQHLMMAYKSPEYAKLRRITKKTDVWCFGIIILEVLTGRFPENYLKPLYDGKADLTSWVNGMIKEKRTTEVFDVEMGNVGNNRGELLKLLKIGVSCCEEDVERRLDLQEVVAKIEELNEGESEGDYRSSVSSEGGEL